MRNTEYIHMKITKEFAEDFAKRWINAWNKKDFEAIMDCYDKRIRFSSPFIIKTHFSCKGTIIGKNHLKQYFKKALSSNPNLHFNLKNIMVGIKSITLIYIRNRKMLASEVMVFNRKNLIKESRSHYPTNKIFKFLE